MSRKRSRLHQLAFDQIPILHEAGLTARQMAEELLVSRFTVDQWLTEHRIRRNTYTRYTAPTVRAAVDAVRNGSSMSATAKQYGVPFSTLRHWCIAADVVSVHPRGFAA